MMMSRMIILRRRTDPKTGSHTLREPAQSKCTSTFHKSHFMRQQTEVQTLCEPAESKCTTYRPEISRKNAAPSVSVRDKQFVRATRPGCRLCANLRNRHARRHVTGATSTEFTEKTGPAGAP